MVQMTLLFVEKLAKTDVLAAFSASIRVILLHFFLPLASSKGFVLCN